MSSTRNLFRASTRTAEPQELQLLRLRKRWSLAGMIGAFVYEAAINPFVPFGPLLVRTVPGWNIYLGDVPTFVFAAVGLVSLFFFLQADRRMKRPVAPGSID